MENLETGLLLMMVGMTTVFAILLIVINLGKGLIILVNKYAPEELVAKRPVAAVAKATMQADSLSNKTTAAIVSAVSVVTGGKGHVVKIEKI